MVTIKELSEQLGVSVSTVSKALNNSDEISERTKFRVRELAEIHGYVPNKSAMNLRNQSTKTFGVIIPDVTNRFFAKALNGIEEAATKAGYHIITCLSNEMLAKEISSLKLLANGSVDGFILAVSAESQLSNSCEHYQAIIKRGLPLVMFDRVIEGVNCDKVIIDDSYAASQAASSLLKRNRKNLAFISTLGDLNVGKLREKGFRESLNSDGPEDIKPYFLHIHETENIQESISDFVSKNPKIDGIVAADNISGTTAISIYKDKGYKIPEDISIVGFADATLSELTVPKLSFIDQNAHEMGKQAFLKLTNRIRNPKQAFKAHYISTDLRREQSI